MFEVVKAAPAQTRGEIVRGWCPDCLGYRAVHPSAPECRWCGGLVILSTDLQARDLEGCDV